MKEHNIAKLFPKFTEKELREALLQYGTIQTFPTDTVLLETGKYVKVLPLIIEGVVKVIKEEVDKEILMYYIQSGESCIMSISACLSNDKSQIKAITETETTLLLVPYLQVQQWIHQFPTWNRFVLQSYQYRFENMLDAFNAVAFQKIDMRLMQYLNQKKEIAKNNTISITHHQIAKDLATARVVISRLLKQLEAEGKIKQERGKITILF